MKRLLQIELLKLVYYRTFVVITGVYILLIALMFISFNGLTVGPFEILSRESFKFPYVWQNVAFLAKFLNLYLAIAVVFIVTNEFSYRTIRQNIIDGLTRKQVVLSKFWVVLLMAVGATVVMVIIAVILGILNSRVMTLSIVMQRTDFIAGFFVHAFGTFSLAALMGYLFRRNGLTILVFLPYVMFVENIIRNLLDGPYVKYFPVKTLTDLIYVPYTNLPQEGSEALGFNQTSVPVENLVIGLAYALCFHWLAYLFLKNRDL